MPDDEIPTNNIPANPVAPTSIPGESYHTLGKKTLWIFILGRIQPAAVFLLLTIGLFVVSQLSFPSTGSFAGFGSYALIGAGACLVLFALSAGIALLVGWLIYKNYTFALGDDSLKIKRGILNKEEVAIPYRQIQDVDINRDLSFQMLGLSKIVILTAGHEDASDKNDDSEGILPAIDKNLADWLQAELLKRANIQKVSETK
jgi:putative membrane protein